MTGLLVLSMVLSMALVIVRWSGAAKPCGQASLPTGCSAAVVRRHEQGQDDHPRRVALAYAPVRRPDRRAA
jgi:hypothetical protein